MGRWSEGCLTVSADDTVAQAVRLMAAHEVGCLVALEPRTDAVAGVITERQYSRRIILEGRNSDTTLVREARRRAHARTRDAQCPRSLLTLACTCR